MSDHIEGPWGWTYDGSKDYSIGPADDPQANRKASVYSKDPDRGAALCNLIAAAPELLAGCKAALGAFERNDAIDWGEIEAAIAKAEGRKP